MRETAEVGDSVGNPVTASDSDNDPLLYSLTDGVGRPYQQRHRHRPRTKTPLRTEMANP